ncbi:uncharacterized protein LOC120085354 isoform X1 [Benincasa hispida]|uniref:uncharacterized protein LOC120085354 isoform X1 n=1 Tax=Benincasa hispida TaxID=102211 RepID=UPI0018FFBAFB|nr:uncharacterized protein LOC120085354 isoform X1 [Benincasa hispida]
MIFAADCHNCLTTLLIAQPRPPTVSPPFTSRRISLSLSLASRHESLPPLWIGRRQALIISFTNLSFGDLKYRFQFLEVVGALSSVIKIDFLWILVVFSSGIHQRFVISFGSAPKVRVKMRRRMTGEIHDCVTETNQMLPLMFSCFQISNLQLNLESF